MLRGWRRFLGQGIEEIEAKRLEEHISSGLPLGADDFVKRLETKERQAALSSKGRVAEGGRLQEAGGGLMLAVFLR